MAGRVANQAAIEGKTTSGAALSGASTGVKLSYTVPTGRSALVRCFFVANVAGTNPTIQLRVTIGGVTVILQSSGTGPFNLQTAIPMNAGDVADINVSVLGAGSSFDGLIGAEEYLTS